MQDGEEWTFTVRKLPAINPPAHTVTVNYDGFVDDVETGDELVVDGGMVRFEVLAKIGPDVLVRVIDPGLLLPRANLTFFRRGRLVRERNAMLPTISSKVSSLYFSLGCAVCRNGLRKCSVSMAPGLAGLD